MHHRSSAARANTRRQRPSLRRALVLTPLIAIASSGVATPQAHAITLEPCASATSSTFNAGVSSLNGKAKWSRGTGLPGCGLFYRADLKIYLYRILDSGEWKIIYSKQEPNVYVNAAIPWSQDCRTDTRSTRRYALRVMSYEVGTWKYLAHKDQFKTTTNSQNCGY